MDWFEILQAVMGLIGTFAVIATQTKNSSKNTKVDWVLRGINVLAMNLKEARNR